jgi:hypothetical protein
MWSWSRKSFSLFCRELIGKLWVKFTNLVIYPLNWFSLNPRKLRRNERRQTPDWAWHASSDSMLNYGQYAASSWTHAKPLPRLFDRLFKNPLRCFLSHCKCSLTALNAVRSHRSLGQMNKLGISLLIFESMPFVWGANKQSHILTFQREGETFESKDGWWNIMRTI